MGRCEMERNIRDTQKEEQLHTFTHIRITAYTATMLGSGWVYSTANLEQPRFVPFRGIGDYLVEEGFKTSLLFEVN